MLSHRSRSRLVRQRGSGRKRVCLVVLGCLIVIDVLLQSYLSFRTPSGLSERPGHVRGNQEIDDAVLSSLTGDMLAAGDTESGLAEAGLVLTPLTSTSYEVRLNSRPYDDVAVTILDEDHCFVWMRPDGLVFPALRWNKGQVIQVAPDVSAAQRCGSGHILHEVYSTDPNYDGLHVRVQPLLGFEENAGLASNYASPRQVADTRSGNLRVRSHEDYLANPEAVTDAEPDRETVSPTVPREQTEGLVVDLEPDLEPNLEPNLDLDLDIDLNQEQRPRSDGEPSEEIDDIQLEGGIETISSETRMADDSLDPQLSETSPASSKPSITEPSSANSDVGSGTEPLQQPIWTREDYEVDISDILEKYSCSQSKHGNMATRCKLGENREYETSFHIISSPDLRHKPKTAAPLVMIVGGVHGKEIAGFEAANVIKSWTPASGRLLVIDKMNRGGIQRRTRYVPEDGATKEKQDDLNRDFPASPSETPEAPLARAIWELCDLVKPKLFVDLHEGWGFYSELKSQNEQSSEVQPDTLVHNPKFSKGSTVIVSENAKRFGDLLVLTANHKVKSKDRQFEVLSPPIAGGLAHRLHATFGTQSLVLETTQLDQTVEKRVYQHLHMVAALLVETKFLRPSFKVQKYKYKPKHESGSHKH